MATRKAVFQFIGDAGSVIKAAKAAEKAVGKTAAATDKAAKQQEAANRKASDSFNKVAKRAAAAAGAYASVAGAKAAVDTTTTLAKTTLALHRNLGLSVESSSRWAAVAKARDVDAKALNMSFGTLAKNATAGAKGTKASAEAFAKLGITQKELKSQNFEQTLKESADGLKEMGPGAERTALSMKLFGRGWQTIVPILRGGSKAMSEQLALADKYGVTFRGKTVKSLEELIAAQREAKFATMGMQVAFGTTLAPALTKAMKSMSNFVNALRTGEGPTRTITIAIVAFVAAIKGLLLAAKIATAVKVLRTAMLGLNAAFLLNPVVLITAAVVALGVALVVAYKKSATFRNVVGGAFSAVRQVAATAFDVITLGLRQFLTGIGKVAGAAAKIPGMGWLRGVSRAALKAAGELRDISTAIRGVPNKKKIRIEVTARGPQGLIGTSSRVAGSPAGDVMGFINGAIRNSAASVAASLPAQTIVGGATGAIGGSGLSSVASSGLSQIQRLFGGVRLSSGRRSAAENAAVGGAPNSDHLTGNALDLVPSGGWTPAGTALLDRVAGWARRNPAIRWIGWRGVPGHGPGDHLHLSFRPRGPQGLPAGDVVDKLRAYGGKIRGKGDVVGRGGGIATAVKAARAAGFKGADLVTMVAIAGAESGYNAKINAAGPEDSRGLWQINVGPDANPDMLKLGNLYDPMVNARAMKIIRARQGLGAWTVYRTGAYKAYLARARAAVVATKGSTAEDVAVGIDRGSRGPASQNTRGRHGATVGAVPQSSEVSAYEQALADADVGVAESEGGGNNAQIAAQKARGAVVSQRLQKVTAALRKKGLRPATRLRLTQERASLLGELRQIDSTMRDLSAVPESGDDSNQALIDAIAENTAAQEAAREAAEQAAEHERERIAAITALTDQVSLSNQIASSAVAVSLREATRFIAGAVSGEIGQGAIMRGTMPGSGRLASVGNSRY